MHTTVDVDQRDDNYSEDEQDPPVIEIVSK